MKKRIIFIAVIAALLFLIGFRYAVVEREDTLPEEVRFGQNGWGNIASAEVEKAPGQEEISEETAADAQNDELNIHDTKESSAQAAEDFFMDEEVQIEPVMKMGDRGEEVKALQTRLNELGFLTGRADGIFGEKTEKAVVEFKNHLNELAREETERAQAEAEEETGEEAVSQEAEDTLPPEITGEVDEITHELISGKGFDEYQGTLRLNARGAEVRRLQKKLRTLGYMTAGADGVYGRKTAQAVSDFQKRHKLTEDGIAGEKTQRTLFSESAKQQVKPEPTTKPQVRNGKYLLKVSTKDQRVYAYAWSEKDKAYTKLARTMVCSTGLADSPTPKGTYKSVGPVVEWGYFPKYEVWAQYLYRIKGPYLFHSVLYDEADESTVKWGSVNKLGSPASHGCIRLSVEDARWIYRKCAAGTTVTVY